MEGRSSLDRRIEQIISSGEGGIERLADVVNELIDSEAYSHLQTFLTRILGENIQQQVQKHLLCAILYNRSRLATIMHDS